MARLTLPVNTITRTLTAPPALFTATGPDGFQFDNTTGRVFLEVVSSTTGQQFTVQTGLVLENEWSVVDTLVNVSAASTSYFIGPFPQNIYNQDYVSNLVYVDHATSAVLQFRAWQLGA
jgi:hypothetical protein